MEPCVFYPQQQCVTTYERLTPQGAFDSQYCYAVFHEPQSDFIAQHAVLFVYPWGQDYIRAHRALRKIALGLQRSGVSSLRFDYRGTGDSGGDQFECTVSSMVQDVRSAYARLKELTGADQVQVVGVRLGALIAFKALMHEATEILCWDPVLDGAEYVQELYGPKVSSRTIEHQLTWINGYPLTKAFETDLQKTAIEPADMSSTTALIRLYGTTKSEAFDQWLKACSPLTSSIQILHQTPPGLGSIWSQMNAIGGFINPQALLMSLQERLVVGVVPEQGQSLGPSLGADL